MQRTPFVLQARRLLAICIKTLPRIKWSRVWVLACTKRVPGLRTFAPPPVCNHAQDVRQILQLKSL